MSPSRTSSPSARSSVSNLDERNPVEECHRLSKLMISCKQKISKLLTKLGSLINEYKEERAVKSSIANLTGRKVKELLQKLADLESDLNGFMRQITDYIMLASDGSNEGIKAAEKKISEAQLEVDKYEKSIKNFKQSNLIEIRSVYEEERGLGSNETSAIAGETLQTGAGRSKGVKPNQDLKPPPLEKDSTFKEIKSYLRCYELYLKSGTLDGIIRADSVFPLLMTAMSEDWRSALEERGFQDNSGWKMFQELITDEAAARHPVHQRRMALFQMKKTGSPIDTLRALQELSLMADFETLTREGLISHLFLACVQDNKAIEIATDILRDAPGGNYKLLIQKLLEAENLSKLQNPQKGRINAAKDGKSETSCEQCGRSNHTTAQCLSCSFCKKYGHEEKTCWIKQRQEKAAAAGMSGTNQKPVDTRKQKKQKKNKKKQRKGAAAVTGQSANQSESSGTERSSVTDSEPPSPGISAKAAKLRICAAKLKYDVEDAMVRMMVNKRKAKKGSAKGVKSQGVKLMECKVAPGISSKKTEVKIMADSGASISIVPATIAKKARMKITRIESNLTMVTANNSEMSLLGEVRFWVALPAFPGRLKLVNAVVVDCGPEDSEILLGYPELKKFGLIHDSFPFQSVQDFIQEYNDNNIFNKQLEKYSHFVKKGGLNLRKNTPKLSQIEVEAQKLKDKIVKKYKSCFTTKLKKGDVLKIPPIQLEIDETKKIKPYMATTPYPIPIHMREAALEEWREMINAGVVEPMDRASSWCAKSFPVVKPGSNPLKCRWVSSFVQLNKALKRPSYGVQNLHKMLRSVPAETKVFAVIDCKSSFHQIRIDDKSSELLCVINELGRWRYKVLPQGIISSTDIFNICSDGPIRLGGEEMWIMKNTDDLLFCGKDLSHLKYQIERFLDYAKEINLKLNTSKFKISESVQFGGVELSVTKVLNKSTVFLDPQEEKIAALIDMDKPSCKKSLQRYCGLIASLQQFFPKISFSVPNLRKAASGNSKFWWSPLLEEEYQEAKRLIRDKIRLSPVDTTKEIYLVIDASQLGLAYCLYQHLDDSNPEEGIQIISCNSTCLTEAQTRYGVTELECLALVFAARSCHFWFMGSKKINLLTDCSAIRELIMKDINEITSPRLQRLMEKVNHYSWDVTHISGKKNLLADTLSRAPRKIYEAPEVHTPAPRIQSISSSAKIAAAQLKQQDPYVTRLGIAAGEDLDYLQMVHHIERKTKCNYLPEDSELKLIASERNHLSVKVLEEGNSIILRHGKEILVPKSERKAIIDLAHENHGCVKTCLNQLKGRVFWPLMRRDLEEKVANCIGCRENAISLHAKENEVFFGKSIFNGVPGETVHADYAVYNGVNFLMITCKVTGFIFARVTKNQTCAEAVRVIREFCQTYSFITKIITDGGPSFRNQFSQEMKGMHIEHNLCSAYNPSSNSPAERQIRSLKDYLKKSGLNLNSTQVLEAVAVINRQRTADDTGTPAERFLGRGSRGVLPNSLDRELDAGQLRRKRAIKQFNRTQRKGNSTKTVFEVGDDVWIQNIANKLWNIPGTVVAKRYSEDGQQISYVIRNDEGLEYIRHRRFLRRRGQHASSENNEGPESIHANQKRAGEQEPGLSSQS